MAIDLNATNSSANNKNKTAPEDSYYINAKLNNELTRNRSRKLGAIMMFKDDPSQKEIIVAIEQGQKTLNDLQAVLILSWKFGVNKPEERYIGIDVPTEVDENGEVTDTVNIGFFRFNENNRADQLIIERYDHDETLVQELIGQLEMDMNNAVKKKYSIAW